MSQRCAPRAGWLLGAWILLVPGVRAAETFVDCPDCPRMTVIRGGTFTMGSPASEPERRKYEGPQEGVKVQSFAIGITEVTRAQYAAFVEKTQRPATQGCFTYGFSSITDATTVDPQASWRNPGFAQTEDHPVVCVSWQDAKDYAAWLSRETGKSFRLPSEAEWEFAARAGTTSRFFWGEDENRGCDYMNGADPSLLQALPQMQGAIEQSLREGDAGARYFKCNDGNAFTGPAARYKPNAFGLYDMIGNAWEVVEDCWYEAEPTSGAAHVEAGCGFHRGRGGSWDDFPEELRSARRSRLEPNARRNDGGFRLARDLTAAEAPRK